MPTIAGAGFLPPPSLPGGSPALSFAACCAPPLASAPALSAAPAFPL